MDDKEPKYLEIWVEGPRVSVGLKRSTSSRLSSVDTGGMRRILDELIREEGIDPFFYEIISVSLTNPPTEEL